jgi:hypothetical protein
MKKSVILSACLLAFHLITAQGHPQPSIPTGQAGRSHKSAKGTVEVAPPVLPEMGQVLTERSAPRSSSETLSSGQIVASFSVNGDESQ